jgi:pyruvate dehydrogenase E2 component (dihydrolipoamide acetyltransferase)
LEDLPKGQKITLASLTSNEFSDAPFSSLRATIASKLTQAKQQIPHFYLTGSVNMSQIVAFRKQNPNLHFSINDFVLKAASKALIKHPSVNTQVHDAFIRTFKHANICVAISTGPPEGNLYAPVIKKIEELSMEECSSKVKQLVQRAREGKLTLEELDSSQGSFTVTNLGMFGIVEFFSPIINAPQSAILGVGSLKEMPGEGPRMKVTLSCDHRAIDGAIGAMWLKSFATFMEEPLTML